MLYLYCPLERGRHHRSPRRHVPEWKVRPERLRRRREVSEMLGLEMLELYRLLRCSTVDPRLLLVHLRPTPLVVLLWP